MEFLVYRSHTYFYCVVEAKDARGSKLSVLADSPRVIPTPAINLFSERKKRQHAVRHLDEPPLGTHHFTVVPPLP